MTKARSQFLYHLQGTITKIQTKKPSSKSQYAGQSYYDLLVNLKKPHEHIRIIQAFPEKITNFTIWEVISRGQCYQKKYLFHCRNIRGYYYLVDWEELKGNKD